MTEADIRDAVFGIVRSVLGTGTQELSAETTAGDVAGWDSLRHVKILLGIEDRFAIQLGSREIDGLRNIGDFIALVGAKTSAVS